MKKRIFASLLILTMIFSILPATVDANDKMTKKDVLNKYYEVIKNATEKQSEIENVNKNKWKLFDINKDGIYELFFYDGNYDYCFIFSYNSTDDEVIGSDLNYYSSDGYVLVDEKCSYGKLSGKSYTIWDMNYTFVGDMRIAYSTINISKDSSGNEIEGSEEWYYEWKGKEVSKSTFLSKLKTFKKKHKMKNVSSIKRWYSADNILTQINDLIAKQ